MSSANTSPILTDAFISSAARVGKNLKKHRYIEKCLKDLIVMRIPLDLLQKYKMKKRVEQFMEDEEYKSLAEMAMKKIEQAKEAAEIINVREKEEKKDLKRRRCEDSEETDTKKKQKFKQTPEQSTASQKHAPKKLFAAGYKIPEVSFKPSGSWSAFKIPKKVVKENRAPVM